MPLFLETSSKFRCYICTSPLHQEYKMKRIPPQYRLCCECRNLIKFSATIRLTYEELCELIDIIAMDFINYSKKFSKDRISGLEWSLISLLRKIPFDEKQTLKSKLSIFYPKL